MNDDPLKLAADKLNASAPKGERLAFVNPAEEMMLKEMGGSGMPAAGDVPSYKKGKVSPPPPRDYGQETRDTLRAQIDLAPDLFKSEARFRPEYANLERQMLLEQLGIDTDKGLLQAYEEDIAPSLTRQRATAVEGDINMLREFGGDLLEAQREADPLADSLRQGILESAQENLEAGMGLTQTEQRDLDQQILAGAADRGMEGQASTLADAVSQRLSANRAIKQQRLANAASAYGLAPTDPLLAITGRASQVPGQVSQQFGTSGFALNSSPAIFNPESNYSGNLTTQNYQGIMDAKTATAANRAGIFKGALGAIGTIGAAALGCWVAREVYGEKNPAWKMFRIWMFLESPNWFFNLYKKYGERFARFIKDKPRLKAIIRMWMDSKIRR
jgi:hypothetical protein